jgi:hypothetical protein
VVKKIKLYQEPEIDDQGKNIKKPLDEEQEKIKLNTPLKEGVLKTNIGVPIVFVINKTDATKQSKEKVKYSDNSDFILTHIRSIAIEYGATIIYVSGKANSNVNILYDYICHILFNFNLIHKPNLSDMDTYFIPAGYDNLELLQSYIEKIKYLNESYEEKITPIEKKVVPEEDIQCEDTNAFFESLKQLGVKDASKTNKLNSTSSFSEYKKKNFDITETKNYETNVVSNTMMHLADKDKKYADKRKAIKEQIGNNPSFSKKETKNKEIKTKTGEDAKKQKIREDMLAKIKKQRLSKQIDGKK